MAEEIRGFVDRRCTNCGRKYGFRWVQGQAWAPCPHCATKPDASEVEKTVKALQQKAPIPFHVIKGKRAAALQGPALCVARHVAKMTGFEAAQALGIEPMALIRIEAHSRGSDWPLAKELTDAMDRVYGLPRETFDDD